MTHWHTESLDNLCSYFKTDLNDGLGAAETGLSLETHGRNELPVEKPVSPVLLFLQQFNNPIIYILLIAGILTAFLADITDSIVIFTVVIINTLIGFYQETKAEAALNALKNLTSPNARVLRSGIQSTLPATELVCGDIVLVESGSKVPADIRLIDSQELVINESMLTGESLPVTKNHRWTGGDKAVLGDRLNMMYAGTVVQRGRGKGLVVAVGQKSELGIITRNIVDAEVTMSPLQLRLARFGRNLSISIGIAIAFIFVAGILSGNSLLQMFLTSVGMAVSAIPEGLPVSVTVALSIGVYAMAKQDAIIRKLAAVETLGSTSIICTDKTGTLTANEMTVTKIFSAGKEYTVTGIGYNPDGEILEENGTPVESIGRETPLAYTLRIGLLCTESKLIRNNGEAKLVGDPTEGALLTSAGKGGFNAEEELQLFPLLDIRPFESENQYMSIVTESEGTRYLLVKGSTERILEMSNREWIDGKEKSIDRFRIGTEVGQLSEQALRVIAFAYKPIGENDRITDSSLYSDCVFVGMQGMYDPPREEVKKAIENCKTAGIKVIMITGDHADTAKAIAEDLRLDDERIDVVSGAELDEMTDKRLRGLADVTEVFARVSPIHKLRIVKQLQARKHIVAMTGDGVNDAPALKAADIGVAMGSGTDVAKEASSMVVMDNDFASIVSAVRHGRIIFDNLRHIILFVLSTSFGGVLTLAVSILAGMPLPLLPAQLLWINLVTDGISTFPLAYEKEHGNVMTRPPRPVDDGLVPKEMLFTILFAGIIMMIGTLAVYQWGLEHYRYFATNPDLRMFPLAKARSMAFVTLALFQIWNVHNSRSINSSLFSIGPLSNKPLLVVMFASLTLQVMAMHIPGLNDLLHATPLTPQEWLICIGTSLSIVILIEIKKLFARRWSDIRD